MPDPISRRELIRRFRSLGFTGPMSGGRHQFMKKGALKVRVPNPHKSDTVDGALVRAASIARLVDLPSTLARLVATNFRISRPLLDGLIAEDAAREREGG